MEEPDRTIKTIFCSGFPFDIQYREIRNFFRFLPGYQYSVLNLKGKAPTAFANFEDEATALNAIDQLQGILYDEENQPHFSMRAEMAKTNIRKPNTRTIRRPSEPSSGRDRSKRMRGETFEPSRKRRREMFENVPSLRPFPFGEDRLPLLYGAPVDPFPFPPSPRNDAFLPREGLLPSPLGIGLPESRYRRESYGSRHRREPSPPRRRRGPSPPRYRNESHMPRYDKGSSHGSTDSRIKTLFIANLGTYTTEEEVLDLFGHQPGFRRLKFNPSKNGKAPVAFANFVDNHLASRTIDALQGATLRSSERGGIKIEFANKNMGEGSSRRNRGHDDRSRRDRDRGDRDRERGDRDRKDRDRKDRDNKDHGEQGLTSIENLKELPSGNISPPFDSLRYNSAPV